MSKKLVVKANCGILEFKEEATPYNPNAHKEQYESCKEKINKKIDEAGKSEMKSAFIFSEKVE